MASLNFKGKTFVQNHHLAVEHHEMIPIKDKSVLAKGGNCSLHDNLIIHGDNLKGLKALLPTYAGKVNCVFIDPPYNTGNESWVYNDNVSSPMIKEWLGKVVDKEDLTRHEKWLCMMMPRLKLLRDLLNEDGAIFISIDDTEQHRLRMLMDEIFGEENFIANVVWEKAYSPKSSAKHFSEDHDHIVIYARNADIWRPNLLARTEEQDLAYKNPDNDPRGPWRPNNLAARNFYSKGTYSIKTPSGRVIEGPPKGSYWRYSEEKFRELDADNRIWWGEKGNNIPAPKIFLSEVMQGRVPQTIWPYSEVGHNQDGKKELLEIFNFESSEDVFITPKPTSLITRILKVSTGKDSVILDSFAGSGTTGHAVLQLNKEDGGNRKFILLECEDYADKITAERLRRVIKGVPTSKDENLKAGLGGTFSFFELGKPIAMESILSGKNMPSYAELARFVFYTATGDEFDETKIDEKRHFIGETKKWEVYLYYKPDIEYLKATALNLEDLEALGKKYKKRRLIFAPTKYVEQDWLDEYGVDFSQLPFEIYRFAERT